MDRIASISSYYTKVTTLAFSHFHRSHFFDAIWLIQLLAFFLFFFFFSLLLFRLLELLSFNKADFYNHITDSHHTVLYESEFWTISKVYFCQLSQMLQLTNII